MSNEQENEQEFDAESLAALARSSIAAPPPAKSVPPAAGVKDDSGLINLKALAAQAATDGEVAPDKPSAANGKSMSAAAAESTRPAARSSSRPGTSSDAAAAASAPAVVAAPPAPAPARSNALVYVLGAVAIAAIAAWIYVNRTRVPAEPTSEPTAEADEATTANDEPVAAAQPSEPEPTRVAENTPPPVEPTTPTSPDPAATTAPTPPTEPAAAAAPTDEARTREERERDRERDRERERERAAAGATSGAAASPTATAPTTPAPTTPAPTAPATTPARPETPPAGQTAATKRGASVDELLDRALGGGPAAGGVGTHEQPREREAAPAADLPDVPPRSAITSALGRLRRSVENCANGQVGVARAEVTFGSDGNVSSVSISGAPFAGTPQGACMERVVRRAHVPRFRRSSLTITYPFSVRPPEP